jgi:hypothetical protein
MVEALNMLLIYEGEHHLFDPPQRVYLLIVVFTRKKNHISPTSSMPDKMCYTFGGNIVPGMLLEDLKSSE